MVDFDFRVCISRATIDEHGILKRNRQEVRFEKKNHLFIFLFAGCYFGEMKKIFTIAVFYTTKHTHV